MKILLISGHGDGDPGAVGNGYKEADLTIEVVNGIAPLLRQYAIVDLYPTHRNAFKDIQNGQLQASFSNYDYVLEIHFNAGGGTGTEIYVTSKEKQTCVEKSIVNKLAAFYRNRGVKISDFLVINTAKNRGVSSALLEVCFIDNANDMDVYQTHKKAIFEAIASGIASGFGLKMTSMTPGAVSNDQNNSSSNTYNSIVDYLKSRGIDSSFENRKALALQNNIENYTGTAEQNSTLLAILQQHEQTTMEYYPAFNNASIVNGLKSIGVDSSFNNRLSIAVANGVENYTGTAQQNIHLLNLARTGKLKKN